MMRRSDSIGTSIIPKGQRSAKSVPTRAKGNTTAFSTDVNWLNKFMLAERQKDLEKNSGYLLMLVSLSFWIGSREKCVFASIMISHNAVKVRRSVATPMFHISSNRTMKKTRLTNL